jgi:uncharacterized cupin superfamily protein
MKVRRVVTGDDQRGKAVLVDDAEVAPIQVRSCTASSFHRLFDLDLIVAGEVHPELDDGAAVKLRAGDTVVENGTRQRWRNEGAHPATLAYFNCGAHHAGF